MKYKIFVLMFCMILLVGSVSAAEWDNKLIYSNNDLQVNLTNWFGLGIDYGTAELKSHKSVDEIRQVYVGDSVLTWYDFNFKEIYYDGLGEVIFIDEDTGNKISKNYSFVYWGNLTKEIPTYECSKVLSENGTMDDECIENGKETIITGKKGWLPYNSRDILNEEIIIGVKSNIGFEETIDVIWTIGGKKVEKHAVVTSGAVETSEGNFIIFTYLNNGTFNTTTEIKDVAILVIAGGGGGGGNNGGASSGGGAGGLVNNDSSFNVTTGNYDIVVGMGGDGGQGQNFGNNGENSSVFGVVAVGGGGGAQGNDGNTAHDGLDGGSGGGATGSSGGTATGGTATQDNFSNATGFGRDGGDAVDTFPNTAGGGGANAEGLTGPNQGGGAGGVGRSFSINGTLTCYAGGGGGGEASGGGTGNSTCGGGDGGANSNNGNAGINGTGGGGGGAGAQAGSNGGQGGNGVVIIRFLGFDIIIVDLISPVDNTNFTTSTNNFVGTATNASSGILLTNVSFHVNGIINQTNTSGITGNYNFSLTTEDGDYNWTIKAFGNDSIQYNASNGTLDFTIDTSPPEINITSPTGQINSHSIGDPLFLNWTVLDLNLDSCWYDYNGTNITVACLDNTTTFNTEENNQNLTFYANDTFGNENSETTSWTYAFLETGVDFTFNVSETSNQFFEINVTTDITVLSISSIITYNGTNFTSTASCTSGNCTINNLLDIPLVTSGEFENKSFFWTLSIFNGTDSISIQTSTRIQNVSRIHLEECGGAFTTQSLNFTAHDEQNLSRIDPFLFEATFDQWLGNGSVKRQSNFSQLSTSDEALCISPTDETFFIDAIIEYDEAGNASIYTLRNFFFQNDTINNVSEDIFLYLLLSSSSTSFILKVQDDSLLPVTGTLIEINRFYPGTNEFRIVQIARTDDLGKSVGFFETEIVDYKFFITLNNETLLETGIQKVVPEASPFTLTFNIGEPLGEPWKSQNEISDLNSSLTWNDTSGFVTYIYIDSSGDLTLARLLVIQESLVNSTANSVICNETSSLSSATLSCNVGNDSGFYVASSFINRGNGEGLDKQFTFQVETLSSIVGLLGLFYAWFLILIASFMFKFNEIAGIWAVTITVFLVNLTGLINFGGVFVTGTIAVALILTWIMER